MTYFPFADYWWFYLGFAAVVLLLLALDLGVFHRKAHVISFREAAISTAVWVGLALAFNFGLYHYAAWSLAQESNLSRIPGLDPGAAARQLGLEFLTGYVVEKSLSLDNIFVFVAIFQFFGIPALYQHRVLFYGIFAALIFRAAFIALGPVLLQYHWVLWLFGALLILTGAKMMLAPERKIDPERNALIRLIRRFVPVTPGLHGQRFFVESKGVVYATPLFLALVLVEISDITFAADSVPAIFSFTREPMIVFTSNVFAILGLRSLYVLLANAVERFALLKYGLALVLVFVGLKMAWLNDVFGGQFPIAWSLGIIGALLTGSLLCSLLATRASATGRLHAPRARADNDSFPGASSRPQDRQLPETYFTTN